MDYSSSKLHAQDEIDLLRKSYSSEYCMHPENTCSGQIVRAHVISKYMLKKISVNSQVYCPPNSQQYYRFNLRDEPIDLQLRGINQATTFTGFCQKHDTELFSSFENSTLELKDEHIFLLAYRAANSALFGQTSKTEYYDIKRKQLRNPRKYQYLYEYSKSGILDLATLKKSMDIMLINSDYSSLNYKYIVFKSIPEFFVCGVTLPFMDFSGKDLLGQNEINNDSIALPSISFSLLPYGNKGVAIFSWLSDDNRPSKIVKTLLRLRRQQIPNAILRYAFSLYDTIAINPIWWNNLHPIYKQLVLHKLGDFNPELNQGSIIDDGWKIVDWQIEEIGGNFP